MYFIRQYTESFFAKYEGALQIIAIILVLGTWIVFDFMIAGGVLFGLFVLHAICVEHTPAPRHSARISGPYDD